MSPSKKHEELAQRAAAMGRRPPRQASPATEGGGGAGAPRAKEVRLTTTVQPQLYRGLTNYCAETADAIGAARVPHAAVVRALIARLETDPELRAAITSDVAAALDTH